MSEVYNRHLAARWGFTRRVAALRNILAMSDEEQINDNKVRKNEKEIFNNPDGLHRRID